MLPGLAAVAVAAVLAVGGGHSEERAGPRPAERRAQPRPAPRLEDHLEELERIADRSGGNRAAGTPGYELSAAYVAETLRRAGYRVTEQRFRFPFFDERRPPELRRHDAPARVWHEPRDLRSLVYTGSGDVEGRVRRIGGGPASGCSPADFAALRRGEVAVVPRGVCTLREKALGAQRAGAAAMVIVNGGGPGETGAFTGTLIRPGLRIPALGAAPRVGRELAGGARVSLAVDAVSERRSTTNVIGESRRGSAQRVLMAGGHLDSVTDGPGLNDNGSGVAALLHAAAELARAPREEGPKLRFAFWGAEELGLLGSRRYVARLSAAERRAITGYVNLDMVGSPNAVLSVYDADARIERVLRAGLRRAARRPVLGERLGGSSDHAPFARAGIPVGGIYTGSMERKTEAQARSQGGRAGRPRDPCYHRACDTVRNVDLRVLRQTSRALTESLAELAAHRQR